MNKDHKMDGATHSMPLNIGNPIRFGLEDQICHIDLCLGTWRIWNRDSKSHLDLKMILVLILSCACFVWGLTGCKSIKPIRKSLDDWFDIQSSIAESLDKEWGGERFKIASTRGAAYPIGTVFNIGSPSPITNQCQTLDGMKQHVPVTPLPRFTAGTSFTVNAAVPKQWLSAINVATAQIGGSRTDKLDFCVADMDQVFVYDDDVEKIVFSDACFKGIGNLSTHDKIIVRGYISCKYIVSSEKKWGANARLEVIEQDGLTVTFERDSGSFRIEQDSAFPWFTIFTIISVKPIVELLDPVKSKELIDAVTAAGLEPTAENINAIIKRGDARVMLKESESGTTLKEPLVLFLHGQQVSALTLKALFERPEGKDLEGILGTGTGGEGDAGK